MNGDYRLIDFHDSDIQGLKRRIQILDQRLAKLEAALTALLERMQTGEPAGRDQ